MDDLCVKIDLVLNECSRTLSTLENKNIEGPAFYSTIFINFSNGPLLQFVKSIQTFLIKFKSQNVYMLCVCLSQIRKCLVMFEETTLKYSTISNFKKVVCIYLIKRIQKCFFKLEDYLEMLNVIDVDGQPGIFIDQMNNVLNDLNNRLELKLIKPSIDKIILQAITIAKISDETNNLELTLSSKHVLKATENFEKINVIEKDFFHFDYLSSSLSILERRINTAVLHLIYKIFNNPFYAVKKLLQMCTDLNEFHTRNSPEFSSYISDLDKSTDILIQIGLFAVACCKNNEYVISLKSCISSLELLDSDIVPAIIEFYLDPISEVKKQFLKLLINHWINEICEIQNLLEKIIDPFAYAQSTLEISANFINDIKNSISKSNIELFNKLSNGFLNFKNYIEIIFASEISKENELSKTYKQFENALKEYKAYLTFVERTNNYVGYDIIQKKLLKRCTIVLKYLKNMQTSIFNVMNDKSFSEFENTSYILSKTKQSSDSFMPYENIDNDNDNLSLTFSTISIQKSFYNVPKRKMAKIFSDLNSCSSIVNKTAGEITVIMELTNILDNLIDTNKSNNHMISEDIWEEININTRTRLKDLKDVHNQIWSNIVCS